MKMKVGVLSREERRGRRLSPAERRIAMKTKEMKVGNRIRKRRDTEWFVELLDKDGSRCVAVGNFWAGSAGAAR
jgi:hypothetical protein